jgi:two-component system, chemotaxis family, chemotaxis protein CheY
MNILNQTQKSNILIVEDHDAVRMLLGLALKKEFNVTTKKNGMEALAWLSSGNIPDIILLDVQMPVLNGLGLLRQLRASGLFHSIPVICISANEDAEENEQLFDLGIVDFIKKPFNPVRISEKVKAILKNKAVA